MTSTQGANGSPGESAHRIVVGVDGSEVGDRALDWAAVQAARTGAVLEIHTAWDKEYAFVTATEVQEAMGQLLARSSERATRVAPGLTTAGVAHEGHAAPALIGASGGADLLVVGTRGLGGFGGLLLGSVSLQCVHHAHCPVTVVP
jgi:nucleotide-binding universal stress UspA family protein